MVDLFSNYLQQIISTFGIIIVFGLLFAFCRRLFCKLVGTRISYVVINYITGWLGTPVHELSHAFFHIIFGHKVTKIDLYSPNDGDDCLGYVEFYYQEKNLYHRIGLFFAGIAPILGGGTVILLLMMLLTPDLFGVISSDFNMIVESNNLLDGYYTLFANITSNIFAEEHTNSLWFWLFMGLSLMIAAHMELSPADIKGAFKGLIILLIGILAINIVIYLFSPETVYLMTSATTYFGLYLGMILVLGALFNILLVVIGFIIYLIGKYVR